MGSYRSKEDDVAKISTSIYVTNFPESFSSTKDLFNLCKGVWPRRGLFYSIQEIESREEIRFQRAPISAKNNQPIIAAVSNRSRSYVPKKDVGSDAAKKSYVHVAKGNPHSGSMGSDPKPAIALDDDYLLTKDLRNSLLGRVKEFASLSNLRTALIN
ncbi:hypothetical protein Tco_1460363, partial [Tanacetum coccineum]